MQDDLYFCEVERIINEIGEFHEYFSKAYYQQGEKYYNLKSTQINHVSDKENEFTFLKNLMNYIMKFSETLIPLPINYDPSKIEFRFRVKQIESAINKIDHYNKTHDNGKVPVQKCLNDLVGFRIIISTVKSYDEIMECINSSSIIKVPLMRSYVRKDYDDNHNLSYIGLHVYFKSNNNFFFPWELQIWRSEDESSNELSHKRYKEKREYISWPGFYEN
ncbi:hypothetical protein [Pseudolactococcus laudensis]|uniref:hypothetical protein n=1 Tax=Bacteria TaxID=2 RepID=UPI000277546F|nr:hypothetical protein BN193_09005 [Lactococcus raffinolactis 4877]